MALFVEYYIFRGFWNERTKYGYQKQNLLLFNAPLCNGG